MKTLNQSFSIVLTAEQNNPSIFTTDFLKNKKIVEEDWDLAPNIICTPQFATISYQNGISFTFDPQKLMVTDLAPDGGTFPVPDSVIKFINEVPLVRYRSLGTNFQSVVYFSTLEKANDFVIDKFFKKENLPSEYNLEGVVPSISLKTDDSTCNLTVNKPIKGKISGEVQFGVFIRGNFHRDFIQISNDNDRNKSIIQAINNWEQDKKTFDSICIHFFGE